MRSFLLLSFYFYCAAFFLCYSSICYAQSSQHSKVIIIDTLINYKCNWCPMEVRACLDTNNDEHLTDAYLEPTIIYNEKTIGVIYKLDSAYQTDYDREPQKVQSFDIRFDGRYGYGRFINLWEYATDTIRISKWTVYNNDIPDTAYRSIIYQDMLNDSALSESRLVMDTVLRDKEPKGKKIEPPAVTINGKVYKLKLIRQTGLDHMTFNGGKPRKKYLAYQKLWNKPGSKKKYRYTRFKGEKTMKVPYFDCRIVLQ